MFPEVTVHRSFLWALYQFQILRTLYWVKQAEQRQGRE